MAIATIGDKGRMSIPRAVAPFEDGTKLFLYKDTAPNGGFFLCNKRFEDMPKDTPFVPRLYDSMIVRTGRICLPKDVVIILVGTRGAVSLSRGYFYDGLDVVYIDPIQE